MTSTTYRATILHSKELRQIVRNYVIFEQAPLFHKYSTMLFYLSLQIKITTSLIIFIVVFIFSLLKRIRSCLGVKKLLTIVLLFAKIANFDEV